MLFFRTSILCLVATSVQASLVFPEAFRIERVEKDWIATAKAACTLVEAIDFDTCVSQVVAAADLSQAEAYRPSQRIEQGKKVDQNLQLLRNARKACTSVIPLEYNKCIKDVMNYNDLRIVDNFPKKASRQRLLRGSNEDDENGGQDDDTLLGLAREACALVNDVDRHLCVQDVLATGDVGIAELWPKIDAPKPENKPEDKLLAQAKDACRSVKEADRLLCIEDVLFTRDLGIAELWPKETRRRQLSDKELLKEAKEACQYVKAVDRQLCIDDVLMTGDVGIADLWPKSLPVHYDPKKQERHLADDSLLKEAKEACKPVKVEDRQFCIDDVLNTGDVGTAELWTQTLPAYRRLVTLQEAKNANGKKRRLAAKLLHEAREACQYVKEADRQLCIDDVLMTGDVGIAELWPKTLPVRYE